MLKWPETVPRWLCIVPIVLGLAVLAGGGMLQASGSQLGLWLVIGSQPVVLGGMGLCVLRWVLEESKRERAMAAEQEARDLLSEEKGET